jgi:hypothetical protein
MSLLLDLKNDWTSIHSASTAFPLDFTKAKIAEIEEDVRKSEEGIRLMQVIERGFGDLWPEKGLVRNDQYERAKGKLYDAKVNIMGYLNLSEEEAREFNKYRPFDD